MLRRYPGLFTALFFGRGHDTDGKEPERFRRAELCVISVFLLCSDGVFGRDDDAYYPIVLRASCFTEELKGHKRYAECTGNRRGIDEGARLVTWGEDGGDFEPESEDW